LAGPFLLRKVIRTHCTFVNNRMKLRLVHIRAILASVGIGLVALAAQTPALADIPPEPLAKWIDKPVLLGQAEYRFLGRPMYLAQYYAPEDGQQPDFVPSGLELTYLRAFSAGLLAWASMAELRRLEGEPADHTDFEAGLRSCFSDVSEGDRYLALAKSADDLELWLNGKQVCTISGARWSERFLSIWLSENARDPRLARVLKGID